MRALCGSRAAELSLVLSGVRLWRIRGWGSQPDPDWDETKRQVHLSSIVNPPDPVHMATLIINCGRIQRQERWENPTPSNKHLPEAHASPKESLKQTPRTQKTFSQTAEMSVVQWCEPQEKLRWGGGAAHPVHTEAGAPRLVHAGNVACCGSVRSGSQRTSHALRLREVRNTGGTPS